MLDHEADLCTQDLEASLRQIVEERKQPACARPRRPRSYARGAVPRPAWRRQDHGRAVARARTQAPAPHSRSRRGDEQSARAAPAAICATFSNTRRPSTACCFSMNWTRSPSAATTEARLANSSGSSRCLFSRSTIGRSSGVLLAATNHPDLLDPAIWRRFELHVEFPLPNREAIARFIEATLHLISRRQANGARLLAVAFAGRSFSDIERELSAARRSARSCDTPLEEQFAGLLTNKSIPKTRAHSAWQRRSSIEGLLSQRKRA